MNYKAIIHISGFLISITGLFMFTGIPFSIYYESNDIKALIISGSITSLTGFLLWFFTRKASKEIRKREGYLIVTLGWIAMSLFGALPFVIQGAIPSYTDAFFETMSGFTTTGASILTNIEAMPYGLLFWRSLTHWLGGMGIIVLSLAILPILGIGGMQLYTAEVPGPTKDKIHPRVQETAKRLWGVYCLLTLLLTVLLMFGGMSFFDALCHTFGAMGTGGFSTKNASIGYYSDSSFIQYVLIVFMFIAGANFSLHYYGLHGKFKAYINNDEFKFYFFIVAAFTIVLVFLQMPYDLFDFEENVRQTLFHVVSTVTTTGYVISDYEHWTPFSRIFFFILMFIGGCAGSTAGSIKALRHFLLFKNSTLELKRLIHPRAVIPVRINDKAVPTDIISNVQAFFIFYISIFILGSVVMSLLGLDFISALGASATCLGNIGPGFGVVGPVSNFSVVPDLGKWFLSFLMLLGRLELFTVLIIFSPSFWQK